MLRVFSTFSNESILREAKLDFPVASGVPVQVSAIQLSSGKNKNIARIIRFMGGGEEGRGLLLKKINNFNFDDKWSGSYWIRIRKTANHLSGWNISMDRISRLIINWKRNMCSTEGVGSRNYSNFKVLLKPSLVYSFHEEMAGLSQGNQVIYVQCLIRMWNRYFF